MLTLLVDVVAAAAWKHLPSRSIVGLREDIRHLRANLVGDIPSRPPAALAEASDKVLDAAQDGTLA